MVTFLVRELSELSKIGKAAANDAIREEVRANGKNVVAPADVFPWQVVASPDNRLPEVGPPIEKTKPLAGQGV